MRLIKASDYRRMPWKNGGGETAEIAVHPAGASMDDFGWRVSMATVASDGPFSLFPSIDRTLTVLEGAGIRLDVQGLPTASLDPASEPFSFAADAAASACLVQGPMIDLNVMTRRGHFAHTVRRTASPSPNEGAAFTLVFALSPCSVESLSEPVERFDAILCEPGDLPWATAIGEGCSFLQVDITSV